MPSAVRSLVYSVCIAGFALAALIVARSGRPALHARQASEASRLERIAEGMHFVRTRPVVLGAISLDLFAVLLGGATALLPVYARDILHVGPMGLGILRSAPAAGAFLVALLAAPAIRSSAMPASRCSRRWRCSAWPPSCSACRPAFPLSLAALFVLGASDMVSVQVRSSLIQLSTPDAMRGRVSAVSMLFIGASNELGEFESGGTAALFGTVPAVVLGGIGTLVGGGAWMKLFPALRKVDRMQEVAANLKSGNSNRRRDAVGRGADMIVEIGIAIFAWSKILLKAKDMPALAATSYQWCFLASTRL